MPDVHILPIACYFKVKRFLNGRIQKFKARLCTRGDRQVEGVDYIENYAPVVSWTKFRLMLSLRINQVWDTRQVDFYNFFLGYLGRGYLPCPSVLFLLWHC